MNKINKVYRRVDKMLSVFTKLIDELEKGILELKNAMCKNEEKIETLREENESYTNKIKEYEALRVNVEHILH